METIVAEEYQHAKTADHTAPAVADQNENKAATLTAATAATTAAAAVVSKKEIVSSENLESDDTISTEVAINDEDGVADSANVENTDQNGITVVVDDSNKNEKKGGAAILFVPKQKNNQNDDHGPNAAETKNDDNQLVLADPNENQGDDAVLVNPVQSQNQNGFETKNDDSQLVLPDLNENQLLLFQENELDAQVQDLLDNASNAAIHSKVAAEIGAKLLAIQKKIVESTDQKLLQKLREKITKLERGIIAVKGKLNRMARDLKSARDANIEMKRTQNKRTKRIMERIMGMTVKQFLKNQKQYNATR